MPAPISLSQVRIANPCSQDWDRMSGDDRRRFCAQCGKHVHNLSAMTASEARQLVNQSPDNLCVDFRQDVDGSLITLDYATGQRRYRGWHWKLIAIVTSLAALAMTTLTTTERRVRGGMVIVPTSASTTPASSDGDASPATCDR